MEKQSGKSQRGEEPKREDQRRERVRRKKMQVREKVGKSQNIVFFDVFRMIWGSKSRLAKATGAEPCGHIWEMKSCTPLWGEARLEVKMYKAHQRRTTFGSWDVEKCAPVWREDARSTFHHISKSKRAKAPHARSTFGSCSVEKVHAVVARSTFPSQNAQNTSRSEHFWKLRCWKSDAVLARSTFPSRNVPKNTTFRALLEVEMLKKCTRLRREAHFQVKTEKNWRSTFGRSDVVSRGRRKGLSTVSKLSRRRGFSSISQNDGRRGTFEEDLQRCIFRGRRSKRDMFIRDVRRSGRWFPQRGCILEHQIFSFGKIILCDRCSTSYDLASLFRGRRSASETWTGKIAKRIGTRLPALHSTFHYWRKSRRIASFLMLSSSKIDEFSQTCFVFNVATFKNWGSLAELLPFRRYQVQKLRKSRRIASFLMLSAWKIEGVSQDSFVFKLAGKQIDRWMDG